MGKIKKQRSYEEKFIFSLNFWGLFLLTACGGGGGKSSPSTGNENLNSGRVIDGYISNARVYADGNNNKLFDFGENFVLTDQNGIFTNLKNPQKVTIVADSNNGLAKDVQTGLNFSFSMAAPEGYEVITPVTTLVAGLIERGISKSEAEKNVKNVLGIEEQINLESFDPFPSIIDANVDSEAKERAENYQEISLKIANIFLYRDGDYKNDTVNNFDTFLRSFSDVLLEKTRSSSQFNLDQQADLKLVLSNLNQEQISELSAANSSTSYKELLDHQLLKLASNANGSIDADASGNEVFIAVNIVGEYDGTSQYSLTLTSSDGRTSISSNDVVSFGKSVAIFKFTSTEVKSLGSGTTSISVKNNTTGEFITAKDSIGIENGTETVSTDADADDDSSSQNAGGGGNNEPAEANDDGIVADGYIYNARVFRDENLNETYDVGEASVVTDANGAYSGLGGSADKPIVADGNDGAATDTSTGLAFNAVLSAPAGSKVVNPITTIVNELMQDTDAATIASITNADGEIDAKLASDKVAKAFGLTSSDDFAIDLTKYDPIANKVYVAEGEVAPVVGDNLASVTKIVATQIADLVISGANEVGSSDADVAAATKSIMLGLKDVIKEKASSGGSFSFYNQNDVLGALGSDFNASSPALEKIITNNDGFNPSDLVGDNLSDAQKAKLGDFEGDKLILKQLLAQSEFGDGILTTAESSNGAVFVVGPLSTAKNLSATAKITNDDRAISVYKQLKFENSKYASLDLTSAELNKLSGGTISVEVKDAANLTSSNWATTTAARVYDNFSNKAYFHKDILPVLNFGSEILKTVSNGKVTINSKDTSSLEFNGTVEIDLGAATLPTGVKLKNLVGGLGTVDPDTGRKVVVEILNAQGELAFQVDGVVKPETGATNAEANSSSKGVFSWTASIDASDTSVHDSNIAFSSLADGTYSVKLSFTDAYGTVSSQDGATFSNLTIDRKLPTVTIDTTDKDVNIVDATADFSVAFSKSVASTDVNYELIEFVDSNLSGALKLSDAIESGNASASLASDGKLLTISYTPPANKAGTVDLKVLKDAIKDESGNENASEVTSITVNSETSAVENLVSYDLDAPDLPQANIKLYASNDDENKVSVLKIYDDNRTGLKVEFNFSEDVINFTEDDVSISSLGGQSSLTLSNWAPSSTSKAIYTADVTGLDQAEGTFTIGVINGSYSDEQGNVGSAGLSASLTIDTRAPKPFQIGLDNTAFAKDGVTKIIDKTTYEKDDVIIVNVVFDQSLSSVVDTSTGTPTILLTIGDKTRNAMLDSISGSTAKFKYTVSNDDESDDSGIGVGTVVVLTDGDGNVVLEGGAPKLADNILAADDNNGVADENTAKIDLSVASQPINLSNKSVDGGDKGTTVDGYIDGGIIYSDNDFSSSLTPGDAIAQANATGGFTIYGASGPLILENGFDISTNKEFSARYKAPYESGQAGYEVINPITTLVASQLANSRDAYVRTGDSITLSEAALSLVETLTAVETHVDPDTLLAVDNGSIDNLYTINADLDADGEAEQGQFVIYVDSTINPAETKAIPVRKYNLTDAESFIHAKIGSPLASDTELRAYNAYEEIAKSIDASSVSTDDVKATVDGALEYQKAAASVALLVDFVSTAVFAARNEGVTTSIKDISDIVFDVVSSRLTTFMETFVGDNTITEFYTDTPNKTLIPDANEGHWKKPSEDGNAENDGKIHTELTLIVDQIKSSLNEQYSNFGGVDALIADFPDVIELLAASIVAINVAKSKYSYPTDAAEKTNDENLIEAAENGIDALTEIVQVQSVVQADILGDIQAYYGGGEKPTNVNVAGLLGTSAFNGYPSQSVGTVVPIRYEIELEPSTSPTQFESTSDGIASEFKFLVTRAGSIKTTSSLEYNIQGNINASDIAGGQMSGELIFDVNEKSKIINIRLNNDTIRESDETITVVISDPTETSQIVNDRASVTVRDDDPSTPEVTLGRAHYEISENTKIDLDDATVDFFNLDADFKLEWDASLGQLTTKGSDGTTAYTSGSSYVNYFELQNGLLQNLEFQSVNQTESSRSDAVVLTITAVDDKDNISRSASEAFELTFDVHRTPTIDVGEGITFDASTSFAGVATKISGITIGDVDSEFLTVNISSDLPGEFATLSTANFVQTREQADEITLSGDIASIQDALDQLSFKADKAGTVHLSVSIDDGDPIHSRNVDGTLVKSDQNTISFTEAEDAGHVISASAPELIQTFEPNLKVGANFWNAFNVINVDDLDTQFIAITLSSPDSNARFRLYDTENVSAPIILDASTSITLRGTPTDINEQLNFLQVELSSNLEGSIKAVVSDSDPASTDTTDIFDYVAMDNAVPDPGGDRTAIQTINEDAGPQSIRVQNIRLNDSDAFVDGQLVTPNKIKILGTSGGTATQVGGAAISDEDGNPVAISLNSGVLNLQFTPDPNFFGKAKIKYVVLDPQQPTFTSAVSEITVNVADVNDAPNITLSSAPISYVQDQNAVNLFNNVSVSDIDNAAGYTEVSVRPVSSDETDIVVVPDNMFSVQPNTAGDTITFSGTTTEGDIIYLSPQEVAALLGSIKFQNESKFFDSVTRKFEVSVKDDQGLISNVANVNLVIDDTNDAPFLKDGSSIEAFTEGSSGVSFGAFGKIFDHENDSIKSVSISFASGYNQGSDVLKYSGGDLSSEFDEATGTLSLSAPDQVSGLTAAQFDNALASVEFVNSDENPNVLSKKFQITITDTSNAKGISPIKEITIRPENDAPKVVSITGGIESATSLGGQYIKGGSPVKIAPNLNIIDPDSNELSSAKIEVSSSPTSPNARLGLSNLGESLENLYGLTINFDETFSSAIVSKVDGSITKSVLQNVLREFNYQNSGSSLTGKTESIKISVVDDGNEQSNTFTSNIALVDIPPIEVSNVSDFAEASDYYLATQSLSTTKELKINVDEIKDENEVVTDTIRVFEANQLTVDLSSSLIRTDAGRFVYDRLKTTQPSNKLSDAVHLDVSKLSGTIGSTTTTLIGSSASNVIKGSDYDDFVDGSGGRDIIRTGIGDDTIILRLGQIDRHSIYDGGDGGNDTVILPNLVWDGVERDVPQTVKFSGKVDLNNLSNLESAYSATIVNIENVDGRSVTGSLDLRGNDEQNILMGGRASDFIWLGKGGDIALGNETSPSKIVNTVTATSDQTEIAVIYDVSADNSFVEVYVDGIRQLSNSFTAEDGAKLVLNTGASESALVRIIPIDDIFVVDLGSIPDTGTRILDFDKSDRIKLSLDGSDFLSYDAINWLYKTADIEAARSDVFDENKLDAWIENGSSGYDLVVETAVDEYKHINLGTELYGTKGKWAQSADGIFTLKPEINVAPSFKSHGPSSTISKPITLTKGEGETVFSKSFTGNDLISVKTLSDGDDGDLLTLKFTQINGVVVKSGDDLIEAYKTYTEKSPEEINSILSSLSVEMSSRGSGNIEFTIADDFATPISKTYFFEAPNTPPTISTNLDLNALPTKEIGSLQSLLSSGLNAQIGDIDVVDVNEKLLTVTLKVTGGSASITGELAKYVSVSGSTVRIAYDGITDLGETSWPNVLEDVLEAVTFTRDTVGEVLVTLSVTDGLGATTPAENNLKFVFTAKDLPTPILIVPSIEQDQINPALNATQFETGKVRVTVKDVGAKVGDKVVFKTTVDDVDQPDFEVTIVSSVSNPNTVQPFVEVSLSDLALSDLESGNFEISAILKIDNSEIAPKNDVVKATFTLDTLPPDLPVVKSLYDGLGEIPMVTNKAPTKILVSDPGSDTDALSHAIIKLNVNSEDPWFEFKDNFDLKSLLQGDGFYINEIAAASKRIVNEDDSIDYEVSLSSNLTDGIYAVIARDLVGNTSTWNLSGFNIVDLAPPIFVVDKAIDAANFAFDVLNAGSEPGDNYELYKLSNIQARAAEIQLSALDPIEGLPGDFSYVKIEAWSGVASGNADIVAEFQKDFTVDENQWSKIDAAGSNFAVSSKSTNNSPIFELDLISGFSELSETIGLKITVGDLAGNTDFFTVPSDQVKLDLTADADGPEGLLRTTIKEDIFSGISASEKDGIDLKIDGLDFDISTRSTLLLNEKQFLDNLKYAREVLRDYKVTVDGQTVFEITEVDPNFVEFYLDDQKLEDGEFTVAPDGKGLVLSSGANINSILSVKTLVGGQFFADPSDTSPDELAYVEEAYSADTENQVFFEISKVDPDYVELHLDGQKLGAEQFTFSEDGEAVTLSSGIAVGSKLIVKTLIGTQFFDDPTHLFTDQTAYIDTEGTIHAQFSNGSLYLDIEESFLNSLHLKGDDTSKIPSSGVGSNFEDWIYIGSSDGYANYITWEDYLDYDPGEQLSSSIQVFVSKFLVSTAWDDFGRPELEDINQIDLSPVFPATESDDQLFIVNKVVDVAGNSNFSSDVFDDDLVASSSSNAVLLDNTPPNAPDVFIERVNGGLDYWEAQQIIKAKIAPTGEGDILEIASVTFNDVTVSYDVDQDVFSFKIPDNIPGGATYDLVANFVDTSGNEKEYSTSISLTRDAETDFAAIPRIFELDETVYVDLDIFINTKLAKFSSASSIDLAIGSPLTNFNYLSASTGPGLKDLQYIINDANPEAIWFNAIALDGFDTDPDEPLITLHLEFNGEIFDSSMINDTLALGTILVDEIAVEDFNYVIDLTDLLILPSDIV